MRRLLLAIGLVPFIATGLSAQTVTWSGPTNGSQNLATTPTLSFRSPGTYTLTVNTTVTVIFKGTAGGGGGAAGNGVLAGGGGGGGATTLGTTLTLQPSKSYALYIGAGGAAGTAGNSTWLYNTTDSVTSFLLYGGQPGNGSAGGAGGVVVGSDPNAVNGANGGARDSADGGGSVLYGAGGGGGGGSTWGGDGGTGGAGSAAGAAGGYFSNGSSSSGGGGALGYGGAGGGGGGGSLFGVSGEAGNGYGGGGGGGGGAASGDPGTGGAGGNGIGVFLYDSCYYGAFPTAASIGSNGTTNSVYVDMASGCTWSATSNASWLTVTGGSSGSGAGTVSYSVAANATGLIRTAALTIAGRTVPITQLASSDPIVRWSGPASGARHLASTPSFSWSTPGTYTVTVDTPITVTFSGVAGGGGGQNSNGVYGGGGGGGGATTTGTNMSLAPGKVYSLTVGAGGASATAGGSTALVNTTDSVTLVSLGGGQTGSGVNGGSGGTVSVGSNAIAGATGGVQGSGGAGGNVTNGAAGGGGGGGYWGGVGGNGGSGSASGGLGGHFSFGASSSGGGGTVGIGDGNSGVGPGGAGAGAGGGGGGAKLGIANENANGAGGGGGGGSGIDSGTAGTGGRGGDGIAAFGYLPCVSAVSPSVISTPVSSATGSVTVTAVTNACGWTTVSNASWLTVTGGASGTGSGTVTYSTSSNTTGIARTATLSIGTEIVAVTQAAGTSADPVISWIGPVVGSQNYADVTALAVTTPGTYSFTVNNLMNVTLFGTAGGGGGGGGQSTGGEGGGGSGGGGGATTAGEDITFVPGKTYTLIVGAGGTGGTGGVFNAGDGGATTLVNATDNVTLLSLSGGSKGAPGGQGGAGGVVLVGAHGVNGGAGGDAQYVAPLVVGPGHDASNGAGGGGGGGYWNSSGGAWGQHGGNGSAAGGAAGAPGANGGSSSGQGGAYVAASTPSGGGGGGGGGAKFGITGESTNGAGGGGGGGGQESNGANGGAGGNGVVYFVFAGLDITRVVVTPSSSTTPMGGPLTFSAQAYDSSNRAIPDAHFRWTISDATGGRVESLNATPELATVWGITKPETVTATADNNVSGSVNVSADLSTVIFFDSFSGADGTPLRSHLPDINAANNAWAVGGGSDAVLLHGAVAPSGQDTSVGALGANIDLGVADGIIGVDWTPGTAIGAIPFRIQDDWNYWILYLGISPYPVSLWKVVNGVTALMGSTSAPIAAGTHRVDVTLSGASIHVLFDGVSAFQVSDGFLATLTRHGLWWDTTSTAPAAFDNFSVRYATPPVVDHITVTPSAPTVGLGGSQRFVARAYDANNAPIVSGLFGWQIDDPTAAQFIQVTPYTNTLIAHAITKPFTLTTASVWNVPAVTTTVTVDSSHTLVYDAFSATAVTTITNHLPDVYVPGNGWNTLGSTGVFVNGGQAFGGTQGAAGAYAGAMIETGATDGVIGMDWTPGGSQTEAPGYSEGLLAFRIKDANNFLVAGFGLGGYQFGLGEYINGALYLSQTAVPPQQVAGASTRRVEAKLDGTHVVISADGVPVIDTYNATYADQTAHGIVWRSAEDWGSRIDNFTVQGTPRCVDSVSVAPTSLSPSGGSTTLSVDAPAGCVWSVSSDAAGWVTPGMPPPAGGTGAVPITVSADAGADRNARVVAGGRIATLTQIGLGEVCQPLPIYLTPVTYASFTADAGAGDIGVANERFCVWSATVDSPWVHLQSTHGGSSTNIHYTVDANSGPSRSATVTVSGVLNAVTFAISQLSGGSGGGGGGGGGGGCAFSVNVEFVHAPPEGANGAIQMTTGDTCQWSLSSNAPWIHVTPMSGTGSGDIVITTDSASDANPRWGTLEGSSLSIPVMQSEDWADLLAQNAGSQKLIGRAFSLQRDPDDGDDPNGGGDPCDGDFDCDPGPVIIIDLPSDPAPQGQARVQITTPEPVRVKRSKTVTLQANGTPSGSYSWSSDSPNIVQIEGSANGSSVVVAGVGMGSARVTVHFTGSNEATANASVQVTVTTSDVVVIAWVDSSQIPWPQGANALLIAATNADATICEDLLATWTAGIPTFVSSAADADYANAFLLKNSANGQPPPFINPDAIAAGGDFRLFNRLTATFTNTGGLVSQFSAMPGSLTVVGGTPDPCHVLGSFAGEMHVLNGSRGVTASTQVYQLAEGRVGALGQRVSQTINGHSVPWIWSQIQFDANGDLVMPVDTAIFPTYSVYIDGTLSVTYVQSSLGAFISKDETYQRIPQ